jgi:uncharacterized membrane protein
LDDPAKRISAAIDRIMGIVIAIMAAVSLSLSAPALAHKEHKKKPAQTEQTMPAPGTAQPGAVATGDPNAMHAQMGEMMEDMAKDRSKMTTFERVLDWLGRLHPIIVHFPIAFFPAALFTAIVGRLRPAFAAPVQFLVIAGGIIGPIAALLGWFDGGFDFATDDWLLQWHRWLGTAIGVGALGLGIWAWRQPEEDRGTGMIVGLTGITAAIIVQGWFGGAMVHGMEHMNW